MKTTVNFLEAVRALQEGKCEKIQSPGGVVYNIKWNTISPTNINLNGISLGCSSFLGEWELIGVKQKIVIEDVQWNKGSNDTIATCVGRLFDWSELVNKPKMKMTLEWIS